MKFKRILAFFLMFMMIVTLTPYGVSYADFIGDTSTDDKPDAKVHYTKQKNQSSSRMQISALAKENIIGNEFLQFYVGNNLEEEVHNGKFTIGNTGGNPKYTSDDDQILLYGHPDPWSSYTTIRIDGEDYEFISNNSSYDNETLSAVSTMLVDDVLITQTLQIVYNETTGIKDTVKINYTAENQSPTTKDVGIRIMLDTMLGDNDGAPFKVPSLGNVTYERELYGNDIPDYWQVFDNLTNPTVFAVGTLNKPNDLKPDKVQFASWADIDPELWDYSIDKSRSIIGDSAVAVYWNPKSIAAGDETSVNTYYGVGYASSGNNSLIGEPVSVPSNEFWVQVLEEETFNPVNAANVLIGGINRTTNSNGVAKFDNVLNNTSYGTISITAEGYSSKTVTRVINNGSSTGVFLTPKNAVNVQSLAVNGVDALSMTQFFPEPGSTNSIIANALWGMNEAGKYQLVQNNTVKAESLTGIFSINIAETFDKGEDVYIRLVANNGDILKTIKTGIIATKQCSIQTGTDYIDLGGSNFVEISGPLSFLKNAEFKYSSLPVEVLIDEGDKKVKIAVGTYKEPSDTKIEKFKKFKDAVDDLKAGRISSNNFEKFSGIERGFKALKFEPPQFKVGGYGEGKFNNDGTATFDLCVFGYVKEEADLFKMQTAIAWVPIVLKVHGEGKLELSARLAGFEYNAGNMKDTFKFSKPGEIKLKPSVQLSGRAGVGALGIAEAGGGIGGRYTATVDFSGNKMTHKYNALIELWASTIIWKDSITFPGEDINLPPINPLIKTSNGILRMTASDENNFYSQIFDASNYSLIQSNSQSSDYEPYENAMPKALYVGEDQYTFFIASAPDRTVNENRPILVYSKNGGDIIPIADDGTADSNYDVTVAGNKLIITWQNSKTEQLGGESMADILNSIEISVAELDITSAEISFIGNATNNNVPDLSPMIDTNGETFKIVWYENPAGDLIGTLSGSKSIYSIDSDLENLVLESKIDTPVISLAVAYLNNSYKVAYITDEDGDLLTMNDRVLFIDGVQFDFGLLSAVKLGKINGAEILSWYADGDVHYTYDAQELHTVFDSESELINDSFKFISNGPDTKIIWTTASKTDELTGQTKNGIFAVNLIDEANDVWSLPYMLTEEDGYIINPSGNVNENNTTLSYGIKTDSGVSLKTGTFIDTTDIELTELFYNERQAASGELDIDIRLKNIGSTDVDSVDVSIIGNKSGTVFNSTMDCDLPVGGNTALNASIAVVPLEEVETYTITVSPIDGNEGNSNVKSFELGNVDFTISNNSYIDNGISFENITVTNLGKKSDAILYIRADSPDGAILLEQDLSEMTMGENRSILSNLDELVAGMSILKLYAVVSSIDESVERSEDNTALIVYSTVKSASPGVFYTLTAEATTGGSIAGTVDGDYNAGDVIDITAAADTGYEFIGWTSSAGGTFGSANSLTTTFTMPEDDVTITANFRIISVEPTYYVLNAEATTGGSIAVTIDGDYNAGDVIDITAAANTGYEFIGWTSSAGGTFGSANSLTTTFTMPENDVTITANFRVTTNDEDGGGHGGSGGSSSIVKSAYISVKAVQIDKTVPKDITTILTSNGYTLKAIKNNNYILIKGEDYTVNEDAITINESYLKTLSMGKTTLVFDMSGGTAPTLTVTVIAINNFSDVNETAWYYSDVTWVNENGLFVGTGNTLFSADMPMTRSMLVTVLARLHKADLSAYTDCSFDDVEAGVWYTASIEWARVNGLISGTGDNRFLPEAKISRQDLATILVRYAKFAGKDIKVISSGQFADHDQIALYAKESVYRLKDAGIISGKTGNIFDPKINATRAEVAAILHRYVSSIK